MNYENWEKHEVQHTICGVFDSSTFKSKCARSFFEFSQVLSVPFFCHKTFIKVDFDFYTHHIVNLYSHVQCFKYIL